MNLNSPRLYRIVFILAGVYNLAFGLWAGFFPLEFFRLLDLEPPRYTGIWACLGMVVGVYGLLYLQAARDLEHARPVIAIGLLGKVLGPVGMWATIDTEGNLPARAMVLCVTNDFIWWLPFTWFLLEGTRLARALARRAPEICCGLHGVALLTLPLVLKPGTALEPDPVARATYITENLLAWRLGWITWMVSAVSLVGFYAWWGARLRSPSVAVTAVLVAGVGTVFDLSGETLLAFALPDLILGRGPEAVETWLPLTRAADLGMAGVANGLYTLAGILLTLKTPDLPRWLRAGLWTVWLAGGAMTVGAVLDSLAILVISSAVLFPVFTICVYVLGVRGREGFLVEAREP